MRSPDRAVVPRLARSAIVLAALAGGVAAAGACGSGFEAAAGGGGGGAPSGGGGASTSRDGGAGGTHAGGAHAGGAGGAQNAGAGGAGGAGGAVAVAYHDVRDAARWEAFDLTLVRPGAKGFTGAVFDGRYVYFVPDDGGTGGVVARYDTQAGFAEAASWATFDVASVNAGAVGFAGAAFDGRFVYLVPHATGVVVRFDARAPRGAGPQGGSFF
jgi:hypothetical protein